ncbi:MAG: OmpH family outer membrane protein [Bacteroidetes bacterium]|nr:OmpH family outer membrane protein [Bacteroidota bacterium]
MKHLIFSMALLFCLGTNNLIAQGTKIGVVDANQIIEESNKGKVFFQEMQQFKITKEKEIEEMHKHYLERQKDAQAKAASMTEEKRSEIAFELEQMQKDIKRTQEDAERAFQQKLNERLEIFQREITPLIRQVSIEKGIDLVLDYNAGSNIVYMDDKINITKDVIAKYNQ